MKHIFVVFILMFGSLNIVEAQAVEAVRLVEMPTVELSPRPERHSGEFGELQYWLNKKDPAPFAGVIVNPEGWSYILTEYQALELRAIESLRAQRERDHAYINLRVGELKVELDNLKEVNEIKLSGMESDLKRCNEINQSILKDGKKTARRSKILFGTVGAGIGFAVGIILKAFVL